MGIITLLLPTTSSVQDEGGGDSKAIMPLLYFNLLRVTVGKGVRMVCL